MALTYHRNLTTKLDGKYGRVAQRLGEHSRLLEVGCNTGYFSRVLKELGHSLLGLEYDAESAKLARESGLDVIVADIEREDALPKNEKFDGIILMDVLEHLRDPATVLLRMQKSLNPGGKIYITAPNVAYWAVRKNLLLGKWDYADAGILDRTHLRFFTLKTWRALLESNGYRITLMEPADGMFPLEHHFAKIPLFGRLVPFFRERLMRRFPTLLSISFLIEATPASEPQLTRHAA